MPAPEFIAALDALDDGVYADGVAIDANEPPPLGALLVMPGATTATWRERQGAIQDRMRREAVGIMSMWTALWVVMGTLLSASAAGFVYHAELSDMIGRWEQGSSARRRPPVTRPLDGGELLRASR
jgi:hypothetical protein